MLGNCFSQWLIDVSESDQIIPAGPPEASPGTFTRFMSRVTGQGAVRGERQRKCNVCVGRGYAEKSHEEVPVGDSRKDSSGDPTSSDDWSPKTLSRVIFMLLKNQIRKTSKSA